MILGDIIIVVIHYCLTVSIIIKSRRCVNATPLRAARAEAKPAKGMKDVLWQEKK